MANLSTLPMLSAIAIVCVLISDLCLAAPSFPCCPGSQQVAALMSGYIVNFTNSVDTDDKQTLCGSVIEDVQCMKRELEAMNNCGMGGGARIVAEIDAQLSSPDACANSLSFVRAMFDLAAKATGHMKSSKWDIVTGNFVTQIGAIDNICNAFNISLNKAVRFTDPSKGDKAHKNGPQPSQVFNNPGKHSAYTKH
uniref:Pectinesterase inhibitor domain-containing protein n=1 Tax=Globodera rostochiensis TaxID=31243 RepID=A0A914H4Y7_GLORO